MRLRLFFLLLLSATGLSAHEDPHWVQAKTLPGDGVIKLLGRYQLAAFVCNVQEFYRLNSLAEGSALLNGRSYKLPLKVYTYNGKSIRTTLGISDYDHAKRIQIYNESLHRAGLRQKDYRDDLQLWVPHHELGCTQVETPKPRTQTNGSTRHLPVLGQRYAHVTMASQQLKGHVYYLISGHGGPDPGAVSRTGKTLLCEDEYAYDVTLRLYRKLIEHGAVAYLIIEDPNDGIRDIQILPCDQDETCRGEVIPLNHAKRLQQRVAAVNQLYAGHKDIPAIRQAAISIHVDSRHMNHRQDVFFCHHSASQASQNLAVSLHNTFSYKYKKFRPGGHYGGTVAVRDNLYVLKNMQPRSVLIELANIQNKADHKRILDPSNRQALANWMLEGLLRDAGVK